MKTKGDTITQDGQLVIRHRVDPAHALRAAELARQAQRDLGSRLCQSVAKIPAAVFYGYAKEHFGLSPRDAMRSHEALMSFLNSRDYEKFLAHDNARKLINQSFGDGEA